MELLAKLASSRERRDLSRGKEARSKNRRRILWDTLRIFLTSRNADSGQRTTFAVEDNFASSSMSNRFVHQISNTPESPSGADLRMQIGGDNDSPFSVLALYANEAPTYRRPERLR